MEKVEKRTLEIRERANIIRRAQAKIDKENGEKRYKCNECPSKYANSGTLYRHKQTHATNCNFRCGICEKVFKTELTLYSHRISHLERTIKCNLCDLSFKSSSRMIAHKKVHTGEKNYQCVTCQKRFTQSASLKRHELQHEEKKEKCVVCGKMFHDKYDMLKHEQTHATIVAIFVPHAMRAPAPLFVPHLCPKIQEPILGPLTSRKLSKHRTRRF